jgi:hypothetical protein
MTSITFTPVLARGAGAALEARRGGGTPGCSCCPTTSLATAPNALTIARTLACAALTVAAVLRRFVARSPRSRRGVLVRRRLRRHPRPRDRPRDSVRCFFLSGRTAFTRWTRRKPRHGSGGSRRLGRLVARAARRRAAAAVTVFLSAVTGLPPFALVSVLAGAWRLRLSSFFVLGLAGRSARFAGVLLVPQVPGL